MSMNSVNTNRQAIFALQSLNKTNSDLGSVQKRVSTGLRVADARDDGGAFAVASAVRSDIAGVTAVNEQLGGIKGVLQTTFAALTQVTDTMKQARQVLTRLADGAISQDQRDQYNAQYQSLATQIEDFITDANYNGTTLLQGTNIESIRNEAGDNFEIVAETAADLQITNATYATAADANAQLIGGFADVETAVSAALNKFGASMQYVENQISYNSKKNDALTDGLGALVDADLAKESANLQSLQTRQQLGIQTLSLANQGPQVLLSLFR